MEIQFPFNCSKNSTATTFTPRGTVLVVVESFIFLVLSITALVGNLLVCMAFYRNPSLRTVTNNFILSLALTDLLMAVFVMPVYTVSSFANRWIAGDIGLRLVFYFSHIAGGASLLTVMLVSINRYFRVVRPELYNSIYSQKRSACMAVAVWIVTILTVFVANIFLEINFENNEFSPTVLSLGVPNAKYLIYSSISYSLYNVFPSLIVAFCYANIHQAIRQHNMAAAPSSIQGNSSYGVEKARMTRLLTVIVVGFYICWMPFYITTILEISNLLKDSTFENFYKAFLVFASCVINPIVYGAMNQSFRSEFLKIIFCQ